MIKRRIRPKPRFKRQGVDFAELNAGDYFIFSDELYVKTKPISNQETTRLADGQRVECMCGEFVLPVDVEITWKRK